ncbi:MAG: hypothetical protein AAF799_40675 [Myxococcota bacterium]
MIATSPELERLESILAQLEVSPAQLRRDPTGASWLPEEARALVDRDPDCESMLREYVEDELAFAGALDEPMTPPSADPFFTARVVDALPQAWVPNRLSPRRRLAVLGLFHVIAGLLALMVFALVPESTARWAEQAHDVLDWGSDAGPGLWVAATAIAGVALAAFVATRTHDTPTA